MNYTPDRWVVLKVNNGKEVVNMVLCGLLMALRIKR